MSQELENNDSNYDELIELYEVKKKMEKNMKELWENVICRYVELCNEKQILEELSSKYDYNKFYGFMLKHNDMYKYVLERITELSNEIIE